MASDSEAEFQRKDDEREGATQQSRLRTKFLEKKEYTTQKTIADLHDTSRSALARRQSLIDEANKMNKIYASAEADIAEWKNKLVENERDQNYEVEYRKQQRSMRQRSRQRKMKAPVPPSPAAKLRKRAHRSPSPVL